ncbi:hypothetical protein ABTX83_29085, partial [Streptomyces werraensis]
MPEPSPASPAVPASPADGLRFAFGTLTVLPAGPRSRAGTSPCAGASTWCSPTRAARSANGWHGR